MEALLYSRHPICTRGPILKLHDFYTLLFALSKINRHLKWARTKPLEVWGDINGHEEVVSRQLVNDSIKRIALGSTEAWERWHMVDWDDSNFNNNARCFICVYTIKLTQYDLLLLPCLNVMRGRSEVRFGLMQSKVHWDRVLILKIDLNQAAWFKVRLTF